MIQSISTSGRCLQGVITGPGTVALEERLVREPGPGEVTIAVDTAGICGTELHMLRAPEDFGISRFGMVLGHEYSGRIVAVGERVADWVVGDAVVCVPRIPCGSCRRCRHGDARLCTDFERPVDGAWAQRVTVDRRFARRVPVGLDLRTAALAEPASHPLLALDLAGPLVGLVVVVIGAGPIGLLSALAAVAAGARNVLVSEPHPYRRALAERMGATAVDTATSELADLLAAHTDGEGADVVFEAAGVPGTVDAGLGLLRRGGHLIVLGFAGPQVSFPLHPRDLFMRQLRIDSAWGVETTFERALAFLARPEAADLVTHEFPLTALEEAVAVAASGRAGKVVLRPAMEDTTA